MKLKSVLLDNKTIERTLVRVSREIIEELTEIDNNDSVKICEL